MPEKTSTSSPSSRPRCSSRPPRGDVRLLCPAELPGVCLALAQASPATQARHAHDSLVLGVVRSGTRRMDLAGTETLVPPGSVFVLAPGQAHACAPAGAEGCSYLALSLAPEALPPELAGLRPAGPRLDDPVLAQMLERLAEALDAPAGLLERQSLLAECLERLTGHGLAEMREEAGNAALAEAVLAARRRLEAEAEEGVDLAGLAKTCGVGMYALHRAFTRALGLPPHAFQTHLRLRRAKKLLRGGAGLAEAALAAGFCDQAHLTRHFTRVVGLTPGQYAQAHKPTG
ncbi:MAG: AraC family transcriptional regulator [Proteobacteria bacterium]|nr:AraC family transcriptional regulator [Pseudomonadota bacterium]MBU1595672.1 AraC family transcriptional regulator [Pseudomonadota bacterium]